MGLRATVLALGLGLTLVLGILLFPKREPFDALGPRWPDLYPAAYRRSYRVPGSEAEVKRRVEAVLAQERGWRFVGRQDYGLSADGQSVSTQYFNDRTLDECDIYLNGIVHGDDRAIVTVERMTLWRRLTWSLHSSTRTAQR